MTTILSAVLLFAVTSASASLLFFHWYTGVPPMPIQRQEAREVVRLFNQCMLPHQAIIYELGCGWGSLVIALAQAFPQAQIKGIELSWIPYWVARWRTRRLNNIHLQRANFYDCNLSDAHAVACYLMIKPMRPLADFLDKMLSAGTPVAAVAFWFRGRQLTITSSRATMHGTVGLYHWPARNIESACSIIKNI